MSSLVDAIKTLSEGSTHGIMQAQEVQELQKSLTAGSGSRWDATGGRVLQIEDVEGTVQACLTMSEQDMKLTNKLHEQKVKSTVHQYARKLDIGDNERRASFAGELDEARGDTSQYDNAVKPMKFMMTRRECSMQLGAVETIANPENEEKISGALQLLVDTESCNFHGNSDAVPEEYDSAERQILLESKKVNRNTCIDLRGDTLENKGTWALEEAAQIVAEAGGTLTHAFMPFAAARPLQNAIKDKLFITPEQQQKNVPILSYPTLYGDIQIAGADAGACKFYRPKGIIKPTSFEKSPNAPTFTAKAVAAANGETSKFTGADVGTYYYKVYAVSKDGISPEATSTAVTVASGEKVQLTITPAVTKPGTGFVICRSKKDAADDSDCREMTRIGRSMADTTVCDDLNEDLPGTGSMLLLSMRQTLKPSIRWDSLMNTIKVNMAQVNKLANAFIMAKFGALDVTCPWHHSVIKNIDMGW